MNLASEDSSRTARWLRRLLLVGLAFLLLLLGQFEEAVFAGLGQIWQSVFAFFGGLGYEASRNDLPGLSTHSLPVAMSYRLLYGGCSILLLHLVLRGRSTRLISGSYLGILVVSFLLLLVGQKASLPLATQQAHRLIDLVCSPLGLLLAYATVTIGNGPFVRTAKPPTSA